MKSVRLLNAYGPTETTITAMTHEISRNLAHAAAGTSIPVGKPLAERRAFILNRAMRPVPPGVPGELYLGGLGLALGYLNRPDLSAEKFIPDLFSSTPGARLYRTGDLARHLADGTIEFIGRADCQVKVRGFRIEPGEIEAVLAHHPSVAEAAVVLREDNSGDRRLAAYLVPRKGEVIAIQELRALLHASLPSYMVPAAFGVLERIPLTPGGKIDRRALPAPDWGDRAVEKSFVAPRTPLEEELAVMLQEILGVQRVGVYDSFFDLGGHSLMATQFIALVRERFRVDLPIRSVFESPTIEGLSAALSRELAMQREQHEVTKLLEELESLGDEDARELLVREQTHLPS
jgi:acyl carrier protein